MWSLVDLGVTCRTVGNIEVAQDKFRAALAIDPASVRTLSHFGCFLHTACVDYNGAAEMYERALEIDPNHILTLCCYADMLSNSSNPRRDDERADRMMALAARKAANDSQRACVAFSRKNIQAARQREKDAKEAREQVRLSSFRLLGILPHCLSTFPLAPLPAWLLSYIFLTLLVACMHELSTSSK